MDDHRLFFRPEEALILHCARTEIEPARLEQVRALLAQPLDWEYILSTARLHRVLPLVYWSLKRYCADQVPQVVMVEMYQRSIENAQRNLSLLVELREVLGLFQDHGIQVIPYKGLALAQHLYGNLSLRVVADHDVIVHEADIHMAKAILFANGYALAEDISDLRPEREARFQQQSYCYSFEHPNTRSRLEVHWKLMPNGITEDEFYWRYLTQDSLAGTPIHTFTPEALLLVLCIHGSKHLWSDLIWITDVDAVIRQNPELDWSRIMADARHIDAWRFLMVGLLVCSELCDTPVPGYVLDAARADRVSRQLCQRARAKLFEDRVQSPLDELKDYLDKLRIRTRWLFRLQFLYGLVAFWKPSPRDMAFIPLPRMFHFLYWFLRPVRAFLQYGVALIRQVER